MEVKAKLNFLRIAPRKVRMTADLIRGKKIDQAQDILAFTTKKSAEHLLKLLNSAEANAKNNFELDSKNLYVSSIRVDEGPKFKRWRARARGQADLIQKKTSHITLALSEIKPARKKKKKKEKPEVKRVQEKPSEKVTGKEDLKKPQKDIKAEDKFKGGSKIFRRKAF